MKTIPTLTALLLFSLSIQAQSWIKSNVILGNNDLTEIKSSVDENGNVYSLGFFTSTVSASGFELTTIGSRDYFISKITPEGEIKWLKQLGGISSEYVGGGIAISNDGHFYVSGGFRNDLFYTETDFITSTGSFDSFIAKYDTSGNVIWCKNIGEGESNQRVENIEVLENGNIIASGFFTDSIVIVGDTTLYSDDSYDDTFYSAFDSDGNYLWAHQIKYINGTNQFQYPLLSNCNTNENEIYFSGIYADSIIIDEDTLVSNNNSYDIILLKTDLEGNKIWTRTISGEGAEYTFSMTLDPSGNIYLAGYYNSNSLLIASDDQENILIEQNNGNSDLIILKYTSAGTLSWAKANGGIGADRIYDIAFFDNNIHVSGYFSDVVQWGGIELRTDGINDKDMFYGSLSPNGEYRSANGYSGRFNSTEEARAIFNNGTDLYTVIRSNSDLLVLGDSIYTNPSQNYFIALGVIGCLPINIDLTKNDVDGCYGDKNGTVFIGASGGFGGPYRYSIDNGNTYQDNNPNFSALAAGIYPTVVVDNSNCAQAGPEAIITEPDTLIITNVDNEDALCNDGNGSINVEASGGTGTLRFSTDNGVTYPYTAGTVTGLPAASYNIKVSDANDCVATLDTSVVIKQPDELTIILVSSSDITDEANGEIVVSAAGGTNPYSFTINPSAGTQNPDTIFTFSAGEGGDYIVEVDDANNCGPASTSTITITDLTNISNPEILNASIYPNPSSGMVTVEFNTNKSEVTMEVFSIDGRNLISRQVYSAGGQVKETVDLSNLDKGMYMIRVDQQTLSSAVVIK